VGLLLILAHHLDHMARSVGVLALRILGYREHVHASDAPGGFRVFGVAPLGHGC
jgi:hypothetical protein